MSYSYYYFITLVQRHELNLFRQVVSCRQVAVDYREYASDHEHRSPLASSGYQPPLDLLLSLYKASPWGHSIQIVVPGKG